MLSEENKKKEKKKRKGENSQSKNRKKAKERKFPIKDREKIEEMCRKVFRPDNILTIQNCHQVNRKRKQTMT